MGSSCGSVFLVYGVQKKFIERKRQHVVHSVESIRSLERFVAVVARRRILGEEQTGHIPKPFRILAGRYVALQRCAAVHPRPYGSQHACALHPLLQLSIN